MTEPGAAVSSSGVRFGRGDAWPPPARRDYSRFCGPRAVAAIAGIAPLEAAHDLLRVQWLRGRMTSPTTTVPDALLALAWRGWLPEAWDPCRDRRTTRCAFLLRQLFERLWEDHLVTVELRESPYRDDVRELIELASAEAQPALWDDWRSQFDAYPRLGSWMAEHRGVWLLQVAVTDSRYGHLLTAEDGRVIAGDDVELPVYADAPLVTAHRLQPAARPALDLNRWLQVP